MDREEKAVMQKARAKRSRRAAVKVEKAAGQQADGVSAGEGESITEKVKHVAQEVAEKVSDLAKATVQKIKDAVQGESVTNARKKKD